MPNTHSRPITTSKPWTASEAGPAPITISLPITLTERFLTERFSGSPLMPGALPDLHNKTFQRDKTLSSDRDATSPRKWDAAFAVRLAKEQYEIARYLQSQAAFLKRSIIEVNIPQAGNIAAGFSQFAGPIPFDCIVTAVELNTESTGTITIDIWANATAPNGAADSIIGGGGTKPALTAGAHSYRDSTLTAWNTRLYRGDVLGYYVDAAGGGIQDVSITLEVTIDDVDVVTQTKPRTASKLLTISTPGLITVSDPVTVSKILTRGQP